MLKTNKNLTASFKLGASAVALLAVAGAYSAAYAQDLETVVVTGYRASLEKAMDIKRNAVDASDSILAEDIGKFPDMNVSESLQRIPGVGITRESGEGREITVRGLGAQFTRVRINGIEAVATVGSQDVSSSGNGGGTSAGGTNRSRSFDFNVFAADLFSQLTVHKSSSASLEEGSLGATVDMHTARPFDHPGFVFTASAKLGYQGLAGSSGPRGSVLISDTFLGGRLGVLVSGSYGSTITTEEGTSSVRWQNDTNTGTTSVTGTKGYQFGSVCTDAGITCTSSTTNATFIAANAAFRPRFPRYDYVTTSSKRMGFTSSVQWQPDEHTLFTVDALYADFAQIRNEYYIEAPAFSVNNKVAAQGKFVNSSDSNKTYYYEAVGIPNATLINFDASDIGGPTGLMQDGKTATTTLLRGETTGLGLRDEHRLDHLDTRFMQVTVDGTHSFSEKFKIHALAGWTESHHRNPIQATLMADYGCYGTSTSTVGCGAGTNSQPVVYDYSPSGNMPYLNFGNVDVTSPTGTSTNGTSTSGWYLSNIRMREEYNYNSYRSIALDAEYKANSVVTISGGFTARNYGYGTVEKRRSDGNPNTVSEQASQSAAAMSVPLASVTKLVGLHDINVPSGSNTSWFTFDFDKAAAAYDIYNRTLWPVTTGPGYSASGAVREDDYGAWLQAAWDTDIYSMPFRGDVGVRYVQTQASSTGYALAGTTLNTVNASHIYHDWLPSLNTTLEPIENLIVRFNAGYTMTRANLASMMPTGSVSANTSLSVSVGNPQLSPIRSKNLDLAFEWYYGKGSMISVAGFWKHLDTFVQSVSSSGTWNQNTFGIQEGAFIAACGGTSWSNTTSTYCAAGSSAIWTFSTSKNVKGAPLYGTEINWQQQLDFLPHPFDNFGLLANYTYVQATQTYYQSDMKTVLMKADLLYMSRNSYNATVFYDDQTFQARLTAAFRNKYLFNSSTGSNNNNYGLFVKASLNVDASASYKLGENVMFTADALNLTNQASNIYADRDAQRSYQFHKTGQVFYLGVKYTY